MVLSLLVLHKIFIYPKYIIQIYTYARQKTTPRNIMHKSPRGWLLSVLLLNRTIPASQGEPSRHDKCA